MERADIEESKSGVDLDSRPPQASYPGGDFSVTSGRTLAASKGSLSHTFMVCIRTENPIQQSFWLCPLRGVSVSTELCFGHLRYCFGGVPPQPNSLPGNVSKVLITNYCSICFRQFNFDSMSQVKTRVEVFHDRLRSLLTTPTRFTRQFQNRVKRNRVFLPR